MTFPCGWYRIQLLLFCQLAAITGNRPGALLKLCFRDLKLTLIRDSNGGRPRLFIYLRPEFTKAFLSEKESPYRLKDLSYINDIPCVRALEDTKQARKRI
ncbi:uncharacterized protein N7458_005088 [Penicillium daleae]|uniref:Tyr recombinase domain-containing protein n=1 Tax=Penicillium daleae TaxID=63821 RepID=A0AAD6CA12_9EURO|nr:uncharacterized protein N7458_005088 [Penicillium daleae]KAJ5454132.1 hypothetical protein N7458_005088 [Penicillium daleae]